MNFKTIAIIGLIALAVITLAYVVIQSPETPPVTTAPTESRQEEQAPEAEASTPEEKSGETIDQGPQGGEVKDLDKIGEQVWAQVMDQRATIDTKEEWLPQIVAALEALQAEGHLPEDADLQQLGEVVFIWLEDHNYVVPTT